MIMGTEDWMGEDHRYAQSVQAMRFMLVMGLRLKQEDIRIEEKVRLQCTCLLMRVIDDVVAGIMDGDNDFKSRRLGRGLSEMPQCCGQSQISTQLAARRGPEAASPL